MPLIGPEQAKKEPPSRGHFASDCSTAKVTVQTVARRGQRALACRRPASRPPRPFALCLTQPILPSSPHHPSRQPHIDHDSRRFATSGSAERAAYPEELGHWQSHSQGSGSPRRQGPRVSNHSRRVTGCFTQPLTIKLKICGYVIFPSSRLLCRRLIVLLRTPLDTAESFEVRALAATIIGSLAHCEQVTQV